MKLLDVAIGVAVGSCLLTAVVAPRPMRAQTACPFFVSTARRIDDELVSPKQSRRLMYMESDPTDSNVSDDSDSSSGEDTEDGTTLQSGESAGREAIGETGAHLSLDYSTFFWTITRMSAEPTA